MEKYLTLVFISLVPLPSFGSIKQSHKNLTRLTLHEIRVNQQKFQGINDLNIFYSIGTHVS